MTIGFDFAVLDAAQRYKLLCGLVVPRPIALITTVSPDGVVNAAPFSFFNVFSEDPAMVVVGLQARPDFSLKDTTRNVRANGLFVINMVDEALAKTMTDCSMNFPAGMGEPDSLGLPMTDGKWVDVPHIAAAPAALECRKMTLMNFGTSRDLLVGEVLGIQVRDGIVNPDNLRTDYDRYTPIARIAGTWYAHMHDHFEMKPNTFDEWQRAAATKEH